MSKSCSTLTHSQSEVIDVFVEDVYDESRAYGYIRSQSESIIDLSIFSATDSFSRHTLQRRATRKAVNQIKSKDIVVRSPTSRWQDSGLALGNMREDRPDVSLVNSSGEQYNFMKQFLRHDGFRNGMETRLDAELPQEVNLYTDGSGSADTRRSIGWVITGPDGKFIYRMGGGPISTGETSNQVEVIALTRGLLSIEKSSPVRVVNVHCDSEYAVSAYNGGIDRKLSSCISEPIRECKLHNGCRKVKVNEIPRSENIADVPARFGPELEYRWN